MNWFGQIWLTVFSVKFTFHNHLYCKVVDNIVLMFTSSIDGFTEWAINNFVLVDRITYVANPICTCKWCIAGRQCLLLLQHRSIVTEARQFKSWMLGAVSTGGLKLLRMVDAKSKGAVIFDFSGGNLPVHSSNDPYFIPRVDGPYAENFRNWKSFM